MKIGFIGVGNMASAMISALFGQKMCAFSKGKNSEFLSKNSVCILDSEKDVAKNADIVILAVKPKDYNAILDIIKDEMSGKILVSLAPNFSITQLQNTLKNAKIVRAMPNTPALVKSATTALCFDENFSDLDKQNVAGIFKSFGEVFEIKESEFGAFVGIAGSLPAYAFIFIEALADAAVLNGLNRKMAYKIASNALLGSAKMALTSDKHVAMLKDEVCSPSGTTIEAVASLEKNGFRSAVIEAVNACVAKCKS